MRRFLKILLIGLLVLLTPFWGAYVGDEFALLGYQKEARKALLDYNENITLLETIRGCGNTGGTGNHAELYVGFLVSCTASPSNHEAQDLNSIMNLSHRSDASISQAAQSSAMYQLDLSFDTLNKTDAPSDFYVVEFQKTAPFENFDLRGH